MDMKHPVFISYPHSEEDSLQCFFDRALTDYAWFDRKMIKPTEEKWLSLIIDGITDANIMLVVGDWSNAHVCKIEITIALALGKPIMFIN